MAYSASKAALNTLTKTIAVRGWRGVVMVEPRTSLNLTETQDGYAQDGIRCSAIIMGQTFTENEDRVQRQFHGRPPTWCVTRLQNLSFPVYCLCLSEDPTSYISHDLCFGTSNTVHYAMMDNSVLTIAGSMMRTGRRHWDGFCDRMMWLPWSPT
mmetsp:Transcript_789/g.1682  ORF Transcript_789/g.1682 Transcript_789/m.1682 type:complete len:154 (-) Transcript_789:310-771(-)